jgi:transcription initiation factor IIE alpha subunit
MKELNRHKTIEAYYDKGKLPRKLKKVLLGTKLNKSKLRQLLLSVEIIKSANTMYESPEIKPYLFCPHCGHTGMRGSGNRTEYPEHWEYFYCVKCGKVVGYIDNSPFIHALECAENNYDPTF